MTITLEINDGMKGAAKHPAKAPYYNAPEVFVDVACPRCKAAAPLKVFCRSSVRGHDTVFGNAVIRCCDEFIGVLTVKVETLFGLEEDERVLNGRFRVY